MSFTYDPGSGNNRDRVRMLVGDTDRTNRSNQIFEDEEIDDVLDWAPDDGDTDRQKVFRAAAVCARSIATSTAKSAIAWRALERRVDRKKVPEMYLKMAREFEGKADKAGMVPDEHIGSVAQGIDRFGREDVDYVGEDLI